MIKQLITEFPLSDVPVERSISKEKINKYAYTKEEVDVLIAAAVKEAVDQARDCLLYTSPSPRDGLLSRMPSSA